MYPIQINTWYNCVPDHEAGKVELCKICRLYAADFHWQVVTYYDGRNVFAGTLNDCLHWINSHFTNRRYYN